MLSLGTMWAEAKVQEVLRLLREAGRLDMVREVATQALCPVRRAASGVYEWDVQIISDVAGGAGFGI
ncbi:hypothetical protein NDU88_005561, partial [Pleurodeles waltl]